MNIVKKLYCRVFQIGMRAALPLLPYREPKKITGYGEIPPILKKKKVIVRIPSL